MKGVTKQMAILDKESFMNKIKERIGDDTSDEALAFMEDMTDTFNDLESKSNSAGKDDWKAKYDALDKQWREKYKQRFFEGSDETSKDKGNNDDQPEDDRSDEEKRAEEIEFNDLFTEKEN